MRMWKICLAGALLSVLMCIMMVPGERPVSARDLDAEYHAMVQESINRFIGSGSAGAPNIDSLFDVLKSPRIPLPKEARNLSDTLIGMGKEQYSQGNQQGAVLIFKQALAQLNATGDKKVLASQLKDLGLFFSAKGDNQMAIQFLSNAVDASLLSFDDKMLGELLKILDQLFQWQETQGKDSTKIPMPETPPVPPANNPPVQAPPVQKPHKQKPPKQKPQAQTPQAQNTPVVEKEDSSGLVLECRGPAAPSNRAYENLPVQPAWKQGYLNPIPRGYFAPYETDTGLDILASRGYPAYASMEGVVLYSSSSGHVRQRGPYDDQGAIRIRHPNGTDTFYAHLSGRSTALKPGARVSQGQWIGNVGTANNVSHLHLTIYYTDGTYEGPFAMPGKLINPWPYK